jgi:AcrR family transcriptional regulator
MALRSDAQRNRTRLLEVAEQVLAERGTAASTEEIAARAGVGVATVFRHFPTKELLLEAVLVKMFDALVEGATAKLEEEDAGRAFFDVLTHIVEQSPAKKAVVDALSESGVDVRKRAWAGGLRDAITKLLTRAQKAKAVRGDVGIDEVMAVVVGASRAVEHLAHADAVVRKRTLGILLGSLRSPSSADPTKARATPRRRDAKD